MPMKQEDSFDKRLISLMNYYGVLVYSVQGTI